MDIAIMLTLIFLCGATFFDLFNRMQVSSYYLDGWLLFGAAWFTYYAILPVLVTAQPLASLYLPVGGVAATTILALFLHLKEFVADGDVFSAAILSLFTPSTAIFVFIAAFLLSKSFPPAFVLLINAVRGDKQPTIGRLQVRAVRGAPWLLALPFMTWLRLGLSDGEIESFAVDEPIPGNVKISDYYVVWRFAFLPFLLFAYLVLQAALSAIP